MLTQKALEAASIFMRDKGYPDVAPVTIERDGEFDMWWFTYELEEGDLELEVEWDGSKWLWTVIDFVHLGEMRQTLTGSGR